MTRNLLFILLPFCAFIQAIQTPIKILKLGGGVITDKSAAKGVAKKEVIRAIAKEIATYQKPLIIINGAGSFGHPLAKKYKLTTTFHDLGTIETHNSVRKLNSMLVAALVDQGVKAISVDPMSCILCNNKKITSMEIKIIKNMLKIGYVPVLFGDMVMDEERGACVLSGDKIAPYLAKQLGNCVIGIGSLEDGVYDDHKKIIPQIDSFNFDQIKKNITGSLYIDVTGGMLGKVKELLEIKGLTSYVFNGTKPENIRAFLCDKEIGTKIVS